MKIIEHIILLKFCSLELFGMLPLISSSWQSFLFFCQQAASWWKCCIHYVMSGTTLSTGASFYEWIKTMIANCIWGKKKKKEETSNNIWIIFWCSLPAERTLCEGTFVQTKLFYQKTIFNVGYLIMEIRKKSFSSWFLHFSLAL